MGLARSDGSLDCTVMLQCGSQAHRTELLQCLERFCSQGLLLVIASECIVCTGTADEPSFPPESAAPSLTALAMLISRLL